MSNWGLSAYCAEVLRPAWLAFSATVADPVRAREVHEAALDIAWTGRRGDGFAVLRRAVERLVPDEDSDQFGTIDGLAQNALITLLYALDEVEGDSSAEGFALVQFEEFADLVDQMESPSGGYVDTRSRTTPTLRMCDSILVAARALRAADADSAVARETARATAQELWGHVETVADLTR